MTRRFARALLLTTCLAVPATGAWAQDASTTAGQDDTIVVSGRRAATATWSADAKYANPEDASQTWSGRGRRPRWVTEQLDAGRSLDDFRI